MTRSPIIPRPFRPKAPGMVPYSLLQQVKAEATPGCCALCDRVLTGRQRSFCKDRECRRTYSQIYRAGRR